MRTPKITHTQQADTPILDIVLVSETVRKPKVLFFYQDFGAMGGIERTILTTVNHLKSQGRYQPMVVCCANTPFFRALHQAGIPVYGVRTVPIFAKPLYRMLDVLTMIQLSWILYREKPALVHVHIGQLENLLFKVLGYPLVYSFHGYSSLYNLGAKQNPLKRLWKKALQPLFRNLIPHLDALLFVSKAEQTRLMQEGYLPEGVYGEVLHNGLPIETLQQAASVTDISRMKQTLGIPAGALCVTFINRLDPNKDPLAFVTISEQLAQMPDWGELHFLMAGTGPLHAALVERVRKSLLRNRIHLLGHVQDVPALLAVSNLVIHPAQLEGFGLGVLEAMATGTPCVAYATGGIPEILEGPEAKQLLAPPGDQATLIKQAAGVLRLSPVQRNRLIRQLRARALDFNLSRFIERLEGVYDRVLTPVSQTPPLQVVVSVIIPVYQGEALILRAVQSVLNQTETRLEVIVVDDGSTDNTVVRLSQIEDPRLKVLTQANQGVATARNLGMAHARGEYIAFLDADDLWYPQYLAETLKAIQQSGEPICMAYSGYYAVDEQERLVNLPAIPHERGLILDAILAREGLLLPSTTVIHRRIFETLGGFPLDSHHEDRVFFILAARQFPAYPTRQRLVVYRQALSGRCRQVLRQYDTALQAELSIVEALQPHLPTDQTALLKTWQLRNLLCRFLMYDFMEAAHRLHTHIPPDVLRQTPKGSLALFSLSMGINLLYACRLILQGLYQTLLLPWWVLKSAPVRQSITGGTHVSV